MWADASTRVSRALLRCPQAAEKSSAVVPPRLSQCVPEQELFCPNSTSFTWCEDRSHVAHCPTPLLCDWRFNYICVYPPGEIPSPTLDPPTSTTPDYGDYEEIDDNPWDLGATPPPSCLRAGRFPDMNDCGVYHMCVPDIWGNFTHHIVHCPPGSHFSSSFERCVIEERAKCSFESSFYECHTSGRVPDPFDCSSFILCYPEGIFRRYQCPSGSYFDPESLACSTSESVCEISRSNIFKCERRGLFPYADHCRKFYYCIPTRGGNFVEGSATCPEASVFNPATSRCTINTTICDHVQHFCKERRSAKYANPDDCSRFYTCSGGGSASYTCPYGSVFNARNGRCERESQRTALTCPRSHKGTLCRQEGRFADLEIGCEGFYVCALRPGGWVSQRYMCPQGARFDQNAGYCSLKTEACWLQYLHFLLFFFLNILNCYYS